MPEEYKYLYVQTVERPVVKIPNPVLRQVAKDAVLNKKTSFLIDRMIGMMKKANGIGLAAPQVGISQRLVIISSDEMKPMAVLNPKIIKMEGEQLGREGCLSIPGLYGDVKRAEYVELECLDRKGREIVLELEGLAARVAQHEMDHLEGILFTDKVLVETLYWTDPDEDEE